MIEGSPSAATEQDLSRQTEQRSLSSTEGTVYCNPNSLQMHIKYKKDDQCILTYNYLNDSILTPHHEWQWWGENTQNTSKEQLQSQNK